MVWRYSESLPVVPDGMSEAHLYGYYVTSTMYTCSLFANSRSIAMQIGLLGFSWQQTCIKNNSGCGKYVCVHIHAVNNSHSLVGTMIMLLMLIIIIRAICFRM